MRIKILTHIFLSLLLAAPLTVFAQDTLYAPMGVEASDNDYSTQIMVRWEPVAHAQAYRIYRSLTNNVATAAELAVTARPYYLDTTAIAGQTYFYWVGAENSLAVGPLSTSDSGVRFNGVTNFPGEASLAPPPEPAGNPLTASKFYLGKTLFWEEQISATGTMACATCHAPEHGGTDKRSGADIARATNAGPDGVFGTADDVTGSPGVPLNTADGRYAWSDQYGYAEQVTGRYPRTAINAGYFNQLFWDGRAGPSLVDPLTGETVLPSGAALEAQALGPPASDVEMAHFGASWQDIIDRLETADPLALASDIPAALEAWLDGRDYPALFTEAFGDRAITAARVAMAIASYERVLFSDRTKYDRSLMGIENLSASENRGLNVISGPRCNACHTGPNFSDGAFHNIGVRPITVGEDLGRFEVTGANADRGDFLTPGLRNISLRGPFMHTGSLATLADVIDFYRRGGDFASAANELPNNINISNGNETDLLNFFNALTDDRVAGALPPFDHPTLYTDSPRIPTTATPGAPGQGNVTPQIVAIEPPIVGNPSFTIGMIDGRPGAQAVFVLDITNPDTLAVPSAASVACHFTITLADNDEDGPGSGSVSVTIPEDALLIGRTLYGRWYVLDEDAPNGVACTPSIAITLFGKGGVDGLSGFAAWAQLLRERLNDADADALANPDGDALVNLEEYFAMTDADARSPSQVLSELVSVDGVDYPALTFTRRQFSADIEPVVEVSDDLVDWFSSTDRLAEVSIVDNGDGTETVTIRSLTSLADNARQFLRLRLQLVEG